MSTQLPSPQSSPLQDTYYDDVGAWPRRESTAGLVRIYSIGFVLSIILTLTAYYVSLHHTLDFGVALVVLLALALMQFVVQLVCFMHINTERQSRERLFILLWALVIVGILVAGSAWIMFHLDQRMSKTPEQMMQYMNAQQGI